MNGPHCIGCLFWETQIFFYTMEFCVNHKSEFVMSDYMTTSYELLELNIFSDWQHISIDITLGGFMNLLKNTLHLAINPKGNTFAIVDFTTTVWLSLQKLRFFFKRPQLHNHELIETETDSYRSQHAHAAQTSVKIVCAWMF